MLIETDVNKLNVKPYKVTNLYSVNKEDDYDGNENLLDKEQQTAQVTNMNTPDDADPSEEAVDQGLLVFK